jgi:hypothetical protein
MKIAAKNRILEVDNDEIVIPVRGVGSDKLVETKY